MFYDGTKLLSMLDINGEVPEIYIVTSNRSAGKTTYFNRYVMNRFMKHGEQFLLLYRYTYELDEVDTMFFNDIRRLFFPEYEVTAKVHSKGRYATLYISGGKYDNTICGYATAINQANNLKKLSHVFSEVKTILFDEFQTEYSHYCPNEVNKFYSIHTTIARGNGEQSRYVRVIMLSNTVSTINPYYLALGISQRLKKETKFLRGDGYVLEQGYNVSAAIAQKSSAFNRAFSSDETYSAYNAEGVYLEDNAAFIQRPAGGCKYLATIAVDNKQYSIRQYSDYLYCDRTTDDSFPIRIAASSNEHNETTVMALPVSVFVTTVRQAFMAGNFRFRDIECKNAVIEFIRRKSQF